MTFLKRVSSFDVVLQTALAVVLSQASVAYAQSGSAMVPDMDSSAIQHRLAADSPKAKRPLSGKISAVGGDLNAEDAKDSKKSALKGVITDVDKNEPQLKSQQPQDNNQPQLKTLKPHDKKDHLLKAQKPINENIDESNGDNNQRGRNENSGVNEPNGDNNQSGNNN
jgi:hypothetical protein